MTNQKNTKGEAVAPKLTGMIEITCPNCKTNQKIFQPQNALDASIKITTEPYTREVLQNEISPDLKKLKKEIKIFFDKYPKLERFLKYNLCVYGKGTGKNYTTTEKHEVSIWFSDFMVAR